MLLAVFRLVSHHLAHKISHGFGRLVLHLAGDMGVGVQREPGTVVAQHPGDGLDIHSVLQGYRSERMPLCHNKDKSDSPCVATGFGFVLVLFRSICSAKIGITRNAKK